MYGDCGLVANHIRTEDKFFVWQEAGLPSNPVMLSNVDGRAGDAVGTEVFIKINGASKPTMLENIWASGHVHLQGASSTSLTTRNLVWRFPGVSSFSMLGGIPYSATADIQETAGVRTVFNSNAIETWKNQSNAVLYKNDRGTAYVTALQQAAGSDPTRGKNLCGKVQVLTVATSGTVTFTTPEGDTNYMPFLSLDGVTGSPTAGAFTVVNIAKTTTGFTFTLAQAPGAGTSVTYNWLITRR